MWPTQTMWLLVALTTPWAPQAELWAYVCPSGLSLQPEVHWEAGEWALWFLSW